MSKCFHEYILVFVTCTPIETQEEKEPSDNHNGKLKKESDKKKLTNFCNYAFCITVKWVRGDKEKVPNWGNFDGNEMGDVPLNELDLEDTSFVNYDINNL